MPWYYAGPEAKPVGPLSAEQLHALRGAGTITPETFVIEHTAVGAASLSWKKYGELFPAVPAALPPMPPAPPTPAPGSATHPTQIPLTSATPAHPLFPSGAPAAHPLFPSAGHPAGFAPFKPTNGWCAWGFALSLVGFCFAWVCGIGIFPAIVAAILCIFGLVQVSRNHAQSGKGLAITGLVLSGIALLIASVFIALWAPSILKEHGLTVTEQTSNDSE